MHFWKKCKCWFAFMMWYVPKEFCFTCLPGGQKTAQIHRVGEVGCCSSVMPTPHPSSTPVSSLLWAPMCTSQPWWAWAAGGHQYWIPSDAGLPECSLSMEFSLLSPAEDPRSDTCTFLYEFWTCGKPVILSSTHMSLGEQRLFKKLYFQQGNLLWARKKHPQMLSVASP